jgi:hypothetical protein
MLLKRASRPTSGIPWIRGGWPLVGGNGGLTASRWLAAWGGSSGTPPADPLSSALAAWRAGAWRAC